MLNCSQCFKSSLFSPKTECFAQHNLLPFMKGPCYRRSDHNLCKIVNKQASYQMSNISISGYKLFITLKHKLSKISLQTHFEGIVLW